MAGNDEELNLVLAISEQTFLQDQRRRDAEGSLIELDGLSIQEREWQEKIKQIKRLYSHPHRLPEADGFPHPASPAPASAHYAPLRNMIVALNSPMAASSVFPQQPQIIYGPGSIPTVAVHSSSFFPHITPPMNQLPCSVQPRVKHSSESMATLDLRSLEDNNWKQSRTSSSSMSDIAASSHQPSSSSDVFVMPDVPPLPLSNNKCAASTASASSSLPPRARYEIDTQADEHVDASESIVRAPPVVRQLPDLTNGDLLGVCIDAVHLRAIDCIDAASKQHSAFVFSLLPQLVEALRFEPADDSELARFLLQQAQRDRKFAFEIYWQLQQRIDHFNNSFALRCSLLQKALLEGQAKPGVGAQIARQKWLLTALDVIQRKTREVEGGERQLLLQAMLSDINKQLKKDPVVLPLDSSFTCTGINVKECFIINSNAKPLLLSLRGVPAGYEVIHKIGDDMRQDALVLQLISLMNDIWKLDGLDLRMIIFNCMPVGLRKGMAQIVPGCATLAAIQKEQGVFKGVFQDDVLSKWLMKHNDSELAFNQALDNFRRSCAGWCVATYLLGIGDRHNDNILVTAMGHVFHIDFGKYMGDWQRAGAIKRDRVPFVFTPEMYVVVNQGQKKQSEHYQQFIDLCTRAFNSLRVKSSTLLNLLNLMTCSNIPGMNMESRIFVEGNLMLHLSSNEATAQFTQMIQQSLQSSFPRLNFAIHNIAQHFSGPSNTCNDDDRLKFMPAVYTAATDGKIETVLVQDIHLVKIADKGYMYGMEVLRENEPVLSKVYRSHGEIYEFYTKMSRKFPTVPFPTLSKEAQLLSNVATAAARRLDEVKQFIFSLFDLADEVTHCDLVYTFFHSRLGDNQEYPSGDMAAENSEQSSPDGPCQLHVKFCYNEGRKQLSVFISHAKGLAESPAGCQPDTYIKTYLRPDMQKLTKAKTPIVRMSCNPTYNYELKYKVDSIRQLQQRVLEVAVWYASVYNAAQYNYWYPLKKLADVRADQRGNRIVEGWFELPRAAGPSDYSHG